jgi:hypothetical protein
MRPRSQAIVEARAETAAANREREGVERKLNAVRCGRGHFARSSQCMGISLVLTCMGARSL